MNKSDVYRNKFMLKGSLAKKGYDWWWHSFTAKHEKTSEERAFFIEYFFINPEISPNKVVLGQDKRNSLPSYFMMNCGTWGKNKVQLHQYYPINEVKIDNSKLEMSVNDCYLSETKISGSCKASETDALDKAKMTDSGSMEWDLTVNKIITYNVGYGASKFFRMLNAFEMFWHAEGIKTEYSGYVIYNGEKYIVEPDTSYGYADKNWGKDYTSPWLWISSCNIRSVKNKRKLNNSAIEIGGGQPKIFGIPFKRNLLIGIFYEGKMIEFNFSKFWKHSLIEFEFDEIDGIAIWNVCAKNKDYKIKLTLNCKIDDMLEINYIAPNGKKLHNHLLNGGNGVGTLKIYNNQNQIVDDLEFFNTGCEYGEYEKKA